MSRLHFIAALYLCAAACRAQGVPYFQEKFTGGKSQNIWNAGFNGEAIQPAPRADNPSRDGWVGKLTNEASGGGVGESYSPSGSFGDFYFEAQVYVPVDEGTYYGIEFRVDTTGLTAGYQFIARFKPGGALTPRLRFRVRTPASPAVPTSIIDWEGADIPGGIPASGGWHKLAVKAVQSHFWFYFDGQALPNCPVFDNTFSEGSVGAYVWDSAVIPSTLYIDDLLVTDYKTSAAEAPALLPLGPELHQNFPNPFSAGTTFSYTIPSRTSLRLSIADRLGREVFSLAREEQAPGSYVIPFDASALPAGVYECRLVTPGGVSRRSAVILR